MTKTKIIDKIEKLLRLSKSPNENEAASAASRAQQLMEKYQIRAWLLGQQDDKSAGLGIVDHVLDERGRSEYWQKLLFVRLSKIYECQPYFNGGTMRVIGMESDVEVLKLMYQYLHDAIRNLQKKAWSRAGAEYGTGRRAANHFRRGYCEGAVVRILERLEKDRAERVQATVATRDLVVVKSGAIKRFIDKGPYIFRSSRKASYAGSRSAYGRGYEAGGRVNLRPRRITT